MSVATNIFLLQFMSTRGGGGSIVEELFHWMLRGFAWHAGSRIAGSIPMPLLIILAIVIVIAYFVYKHHQNKND